MTMISIAHRTTVATIHRRRLTLCPETRRIEDSLVSAGAVISARGEVGVHQQQARLFDAVDVQASSCSRRDAAQ
jgi:hypothetical protein